MNCTSCGTMVREDSDLRSMRHRSGKEVPRLRATGVPFGALLRHVRIDISRRSFRRGASCHTRRKRGTSGEGERRQLTVLFADVVGATTLSGRLDPEALRALLLAYQQVCVECTGRYGGNIHQYAGDGVLAYFGYPVAHDNDAERAVLTGLDIVEGMRRLAAGLRQRGEEEVWVRVGVHTGVVVVGEMGAGDVREVHAIGETPNIAARIQGEAAPGSVCISAATLRLLKPRFQTRSMGNRLLKGMAKEIELFAVDAVFADAIADGAIPRHTMRH